MVVYILCQVHLGGGMWSQTIVATAILADAMPTALLPELQTGRQDRSAAADRNILMVHPVRHDRGYRGAT